MGNKRKEIKKSALREWVEAAIIGFILAMFIRTFFIQAFKIPTGSMKETLVPGDRILVEKVTYGPLVPFTKFRIPGFRKPERGEVIVFIFPESKKDYVKRLIAFGGEEVLIKKGRIYINGMVITDPRIANTYYYNDGIYGAEDRPVTVPEGYYFVLGDNSSSSYDSRFWGFVPKENVIGRALLIYWPPNRVRLIK